MVNRNFTAECLEIAGALDIKFTLIKKMHCYFHHGAEMRGYISRKWEAGICEYSGRFGDGYLLVFPRFDTTNYVHVEYWIKEV